MDLRSLYFTMTVVFQNEHNVVRKKKAHVIYFRDQFMRCILACISLVLLSSTLGFDYHHARFTSLIMAPRTPYG